jgi:hypothetical protein
MSCSDDHDYDDKGALYAIRRDYEGLGICSDFISE